MKQELLEQLNMTDLEDKGVKIYNSGIKYTVSHKDLHQDLPEARHINRQKIKQAVTDKLDQLEREFQERDDKIQRIVETEQSMSGSNVHVSRMSTTNEVPVTQNLLKMDTGKFIQTIQEHMDEGLTTGFDKIQPQPFHGEPSSGLGRAKSKLKQLGVVAEDYPLDVSLAENIKDGEPLKLETNLTMLPEIKGPIKSVRMLLMKDLEADGVIRRNIPYSSAKRTPSKPDYLSRQ